MSQESSDSKEPPVWIAAGEIRRRLSDSVHEGNNKAFNHDPEDPSAAALKEPWQVCICSLALHVYMHILITIFFYFS